MASEKAKRVAQDVIRKVQKGTFKSYKESIATQYKSTLPLHPKKVTETKSYKSVMVPFVKQLEQERQRLMAEMVTRDLSQEEYKVMVDAVDKLTKNAQLLSGGNTEQVALVLPSDVTQKYEPDAGTEPDCEG